MIRGVSGLSVDYFTVPGHDHDDDHNDDDDHVDVDDDVDDLKRTLRRGQQQGLLQSTLTMIRGQSDKSETCLVLFFLSITGSSILHPCDSVFHSVTRLYQIELGTIRLGVTQKCC